MEIVKINMEVAVVLTVFAGIIISYLLNKLVKLTNDIQNNFGNLTILDYQSLTIKIHQFLALEDNCDKLSYYFRPSTEYMNILNYLFELRPDHIITLNDEEGPVNIRDMAVNKLYYFGYKLFNFKQPQIRYIPIPYKQTTFFSNYGQLNALMWIIDTGIHSYITENYNELLLEINNYSEEIKKRFDKNTMSSSSSSSDNDSEEEDNTNPEDNINTEEDNTNTNPEDNINTEEDNTNTEEDNTNN